MVPLPGVQRHQYHQSSCITRASHGDIAESRCYPPDWGRGDPTVCGQSKASISVHGVAQVDLTYIPMQQTLFPSLGNMQPLSNKQAL